MVHSATEMLARKLAEIFPDSSHAGWCATLERAEVSEPAAQWLNVRVLGELDRSGAELLGDVEWSYFCHAMVMHRRYGMPPMENIISEMNAVRDHHIAAGKVSEGDARVAFARLEELLELSGQVEQLANARQAGAPIEMRR